MSSPTGPDFSRMMPGMDFLQNLMTGAGGARGAGAGAAMPPWLLPTMDLDELDKRIQDLKTVQFWLEQNSRVLATTIQTLEVQRMTVATLKGLNVTAKDLMKGWAQAPDAAQTPTGEPPATAAPDSADAPPSDESAPTATDTSAGEAVGAGVQQAMQWWQQVNQQFGQMVATAAASAPSPEGSTSSGEPGPDASKASPSEAASPVRKRARRSAAKSPADKS